MSTYRPCLHRIPHHQPCRTSSTCPRQQDIPPAHSNLPASPTVQQRRFPNPTRECAWTKDNDTVIGVKLFVIRYLKGGANGMLTRAEWHVNLTVYTVIASKRTKWRDSQLQVPVTFHTSDDGQGRSENIVANFRNTTARQYSAFSKTSTNR